MKKLIVLMTVAMTVNASASCLVNVKTKTAKASSGFIDGVSFSKKQLEALKTVCTVKRSNMSKKELIEMERAAFEKRVARINKSK